MVSLTKIVSKQNPFMFIFFTFIAVSLWLGDGKQAFVELVAAVVILFLIILAIMQRRSFHLPKTLTLAWMMLFVVNLISLLISDSIAYSVSAFVRLILGFSVFTLFYNLDKNLQKNLNTFVVWLIGTTVFAILSAYILIAAPALAQKLPPMNLLYAFFGHNYLIALLLFTIPIIVYKFLLEPTRKNGLLVLIYFLGLFITFARGATILLVLYFAWQFILSLKQRSALPKIFFAGIALIVLTATIFYGSLAYILPSKADKPPTDWLDRQALRKFSLNEARFHYWRQAITSIKKNPGLGSGPGTFILQSKEYQQQPDTESYFAHSFLLETAVETGAFGILAMGVILVSIFYNFYKNYNSYKSYTPKLIIQGLILAFIYSLYDFSFNYLLIWLIFLGTSGLVCGISKQKEKGYLVNNSRLTAAGATFLLIFYITSIASLLLKLNSSDRNIKLAFYIAPYRLNQTVDYLKLKEHSQQPLTNLDNRLIKVFHQHDPEILALQTRINYKTGNHAFLLEKYYTLIRLDPYTWKSYINLMDYLIQIGDRQQVSLLIKMMTHTYVPDTQSQLKLIDFTQPGLSQALIDHKNYLGNKGTAKEKLQKLYYFAGLDMIKNYPETTRQLWTLARDLHPNWSYYHLELAALEAHKFDKIDSARQILEECKKNKYAAYSCSLNSSDKLPPIGEYVSHISTIPEILK